MNHPSHVEMIKIKKKIGELNKGEKEEEEQHTEVLVS